MDTGGSNVAIDFAQVQVTDASANVPKATLHYVHQSPNANVFCQGKEGINRNQAIVTYKSQAPTPLSCVCPYLGEFWSKNQV
jgi:hypothetical protein